jgi:hypothetical protein
MTSTLMVTVYTWPKGPSLRDVPLYNAEKGFTICNDINANVNCLHLAWRPRSLQYAKTSMLTVTVSTWPEGLHFRQVPMYNAGRSLRYAKTSILVVTISN